MMMFAAGAVQAQQAQTTAAFDGTYQGVSMKLLELTTQSSPNGNLAARYCPQYPFPGKLFITQGQAHTNWDHDPYGMKGDVAANGILVMRTGGGARLDGKIDASGKLVARGGATCQYDFVWQRR
jgi:hypothetical protein